MTTTIIAQLLFVLHDMIIILYLYCSIVKYPGTEMLGVCHGRTYPFGIVKGIAPYEEVKHFPTEVL